MKEIKFLSIAIGILQGMQAHKNEPITLITAEQMYEVLSGIRREMPAQEGELQSERLDLGAEIEITTTDAEGNGIPAQIKLFKLLPNETAQNFDRVNNKITMQREMTDGNGHLICNIAAGRYVLEITHGSEYEIINDSITAEKDTKCSRKYQLTKFVDLEKAGWYAGDLHHHSIYSSPVYGGTDDVTESPSEVCNSMMAMGLSFGALSDHHNVLNHEAWKKEKKENFLPVISKEISTSNGHVMALGVEKDVIYAIPEDNDRTDEKLRNEFQRIVQQIKDTNGLAQLNHPRDLSVSISWNPDFYDMIDIFETVEIWNGSNPMLPGSTNDMAYKLWVELLKQGKYIPATTGSDTHNIKANDYNAFYYELTELYLWIKKHKKQLPVDYKDAISVLEQLYEKVFPILEKWAETNLTSGGVRTYIYCKEQLDQEKVLKAIRAGNSFLTDGPILIPEIWDEHKKKMKIPGEHVLVEKTQKNVTCKIKLLANRPLTRLQVCSENAVTEVVELQTRNQVGQEPGFYDYSMEISVEIADKSCIYFIADSDCTNMAISNPIFLERK